MAFVKTWSSCIGKGTLYIQLFNLFLSMLKTVISSSVCQDCNTCSAMPQLLEKSEFKMSSCKFCAVEKNDFNCFALENTAELHSFTSFTNNTPSSTSTGIHSFHTCLGSAHLNYFFCKELLLKLIAHQLCQLLSFKNVKKC